MGLVVTSHRRRIVMAVLLALAASGFFVRRYAAPGSTLHDVGTLLLVLWLPAVGNLIAFLIRKIPRRGPKDPFGVDTAFVPHVRIDVDASMAPAGLLQALPPSERRCTLLVGQQGFTARLERPVAEVFAQVGAQQFALQLLRPEVALPVLADGTQVHIVVGATGIAKGQVLGG